MNKASLVLALAVIIAIAIGVVGAVAMENQFQSERCTQHFGLDMVVGGGILAVLGAMMATVVSQSLSPLSALSLVCLFFMAIASLGGSMMIMGLCLKFVCM